MIDQLEPGGHHATAVAFDQFGVLILGKSGAGKSELALSLIDKGATLVSDDLVLVDNDGYLSKPPNGPDSIEIRKVGIFNAPMQQRALLKLIVDLDMEETKRLPPLRQTRIGDHVVPLIGAKGILNLDIVVAHFVKYGRNTP